MWSSQTCCLPYLCFYFLSPFVFFFVISFLFFSFFFYYLVTTPSHHDWGRVIDIYSVITLFSSSTGSIMCVCTITSALYFKRLVCHSMMLLLPSTTILSPSETLPAKCLFDASKNELIMIENATLVKQLLLWAFHFYYSYMEYMFCCLLCVNCVYVFNELYANALALRA